MTRCVVAIWDVSLTWGTQDVPFCAFLFLFCHQHAFSCWAARVCMSALSFAGVSNDIGLKMPFHWLSGNCNCPYWKKLIPAQVFNALYDRFRQVLKDISAEGVTSYSDLKKFRGDEYVIFGCEIKRTSFENRAGIIFLRLMWSPRKVGPLIKT